jgi:hypothetical protein
MAIMEAQMATLTLTDMVVVVPVVEVTEVVTKCQIWALA